MYQYNKNALVKSLLFEEREATLPVDGNSMIPTFTKDQHVTVLPISHKPLRCGMCCVYLKKNILVVHRVISLSKWYVYLIGDNNAGIEKVSHENIIGYITNTEKRLLHVYIIFINMLFFPLHKTVFFKYRKTLIRLAMKVRHL